MAHIFVSYDSEDRDLARAIVALLEAHGWSVWWDRRIPAGKTWRAVLDKALEEMDCMLVLWSSRSVESHWVIEEAEEGRSRGKLLPVLIEPVRPPRGFREIQASSFVDWDRTAEAACFRTLLQDLAALTGEQPREAARARAEAVQQPDAPAPDTAPKPKAGDSPAPAAQPRHAPREPSPDVSSKHAERAVATGVQGWGIPGARKLAAGIGVAAVALLAAIVFSDRDTATESESASRALTPPPDSAPPRSSDAQPAASLVTPSSEPLVRPSSEPLERPSSSLLAPLPSRDDASRPTVETRSLVGGNPLSTLPRSAAMEQRSRELEERRKQRQAEIERKIRAMKGTPSEIERERTRLEMEALAEDQKEMSKELDELHRQALESIKSIKQ